MFTKNCAKLLRPALLVNVNRAVNRSTVSKFSLLINGEKKIFLSNCFGKQYIRTSAVNHEVVAFKLSDIGEGISEVILKEWFVKEGDRVSQFDSICEVQSDKASVTITSRYDGVVKKLYYQVDETAKVGFPLIDIDRTTDDSNEQIDEVSDQDATKHVETLTEKIHHYEEMDKDKVLTTPAVRRLAAESSVELSQVRGTGRDGRILKEDIMEYIKNRDNFTTKHSEIIPPAAESSLSTAKPIVHRTSVQLTDSDRTEKIKGVAKIMVKTMTQSLKVPHFNYGDEVDFTNLIQLRDNLKEEAAKRNIRLSFMPFLIKAASMALRNYPILNASVDDNCETITYKSSHNIGVAIDTPQGLIVPNIKNVNNLSVFEIAAELNRLQQLASKGELSNNDLKGGTFTLSNIGALGGKFGIPITLQPEVAIGALGKVMNLPRFDDNGNIRKASIVTVVWSADHRVIDGATICRFSEEWRSYVEQPSKMVVNLK